MEPQIFRASSSAYAVLCGPWLLIAALWAYVSIQTGRVQYAPIAICLALQRCSVYGLPPLGSSWPGKGLRTAPCCWVLSRRSIRTYPACPYHSHVSVECRYVARFSSALVERC